MIIPISLLDAEQTDGDATIQEKAIKRATNFINNSAKKYIKFDNYNTVDDTTNAPDQIVAICLEVSKIYYNESINEVAADGEEKLARIGINNNYKTELLDIDINPEWCTKNIVLDEHEKMIIGERSDTTHNYPSVLPFDAQVIDGDDATAVFVYGVDFTIVKGDGIDEYPGAWYLRSYNDSIDGCVLKYMKTFKNNVDDYIIYGK